MVLESVYSNFGKAVKEKGLTSFTLLSTDAIEMISQWTPDQVQEMYAPFGIRFLNNEARAWRKLEKFHLVDIIRGIIETKKTLFRW